MININELPKRRSSWIRIANVPRARLGWEFSDCKEVVDKDLALCKRWIKHVKEGNVIRADGRPACGKGLLLVGEPGHGKTTLSLAILQEIMRTFTSEDFVVDEGKTIVKPCYFATFNDLIELKGAEIGGSSTDEQERLLLGILGECADDAYNVRVLVIDDVGKEHTSASGWQSSLLHHILRTRFNNGLPTIVTTNIPVKAWEGIYGSATGSFIHEAFATIELQSIRGDLRK
jgi:DNA replication protein DnaC